MARLRCTLSPGLSEEDRDFLRERMEAVLAPLGGAVTDATTGPSEDASHFEVALASKVPVRDAIAPLLALMSGVPFTLPTRVTMVEDGQVVAEVVVGGPGECR